MIPGVSTPLPLELETCYIRQERRFQEAMTVIPPHKVQNDGHKHQTVLPDQGFRALPSMQDTIVLIP
jgi:hypothetical protein